MKLIFLFSKKKWCLSYTICPTKNCPSRYEVLPGHLSRCLYNESVLTSERLILVIGYSPPHITPSSSVGGKGDVPDGETTPAITKSDGMTADTMITHNKLRYSDIDS